MPQSVVLLHANSFLPCVVVQLITLSWIRLYFSFFFLVFGVGIDLRYHSKPEQNSLSVDGCKNRTASVCVRLFPPFEFCILAHVLVSSLMFSYPPFLPLEIELSEAKPGDTTTDSPRMARTKPSAAEPRSRKELRSKSHRSRTVEPRLDSHDATRQVNIQDGLGNSPSTSIDESDSSVTDSSTEQSAHCQSSGEVHCMVTGGMITN